MSTRPAEAPLRRFSYAILDVDGTLVDNLDLIVDSFNVAVSDYAGKKFTNAEAYARFGPTLEKMIADIVPSRKLEDAIERYYEHYERHFDAMARPYPGVENLLDAMEKAGLRVSACTGSSLRMTEITLGRSRLRNAFSTIITADDVTSPKPDPEGILLAVRRMRADTVSTISLGDSARDIVASRRAGVRSAAALWGFGGEDKLKAAMPHYAFKTPSEAPLLFT
jgi:HAD superfamily hydrolase (TIGR01509 family)